MKKTKGYEISLDNEEMAVMNGGASVRQRLSAFNYDPGPFAPYSFKGKTYITQRDPDGSNPRTRLVTNAPQAYSRDAWLHAEETIVRSSRTKLRIIDDLTAAGLTFQVPEGMGVTQLREPVSADFGEARIVMDPTAKSRRNRPELTYRTTPLPLIVASQSFGGRDLAVSRNGQNRLPIDTVTLEQNTRKMWEKAEGLFIGTETFTFAGDTLYGLTTHPQRLTTTLTLPTAPGWTPAVLVDEVAAMVQALNNIEFTGPFGTYYSRAWMQYFVGDFADTYGGVTLWKRLQEIGQASNISWMRQLDGLGSGFKIIIFQLTSDVVRVVNIVPMRLINWNAMGGLVEHWQQILGVVPQFRTNADNEIGINHGVGA